MNKRLILTALICIVSIFSIKSQTYEKLANNKEITSVYISKSMLSLAGGIDMGSADINSLMSKLEGIEIYTSEGKLGQELISDEIDKMEKNKSFELLMKVKDEEDNIIFYSRKQKDKMELVMAIKEPDESLIIRIFGDFTLEDIQKLINDNM